MRALVALACILAVGSATAGDVEAGRKKATEICASCHGADGNSPSPEFPKLAGQHADYLVKTLRDYKSGARKNPIMQGFAAQLTAQDIANLAAFYARQKGLVTKY